MSMISNRAWRGFLRGGMETLKQFPECRSLSASEQTAGGFLVGPPEFVGRIENGRKALNPVRRLASVFPLNPGAAAAYAPSVDTPPTATWRASENQTIPWDSATRTGKREWNPRIEECNFKVSERLLRASESLGVQFVADETARAFAALEEADFLLGDGQNEPLGVFAASDQGISTSRDVASGSATGATIAGLRNVVAALGSDYFPNATWIMHGDFWAIITALDATASPTVINADQMRLFSRPVVLSDKAPSVFTDGLYAAILGDFEAGYWIVDAPVTPRDAAESGYIGVKPAVELFAESDQVGFRGIAETDGFPVRESAFVRVKCST